MIINAGEERCDRRGPGAEDQPSRTVQDQREDGRGAGATSALAPAVKIGTALFVGMGADGPVAAEEHPTQMRINYEAMVAEPTEA
jgi:hypothetical protein